MTGIFVPPADVLGKPSGVNWKLNPNHPLNQGLVAWWLMNEGAGNYVRDLVGRRHLTPLSSYTWGQCPYGANVGGGDNALLYGASSFTPGIDDMVGAGTVMVAMKPYTDPGIDGLIQSCDAVTVDYKGWTLQTDMNASYFANSLVLGINDGTAHYVSAGNNFLGVGAVNNWHVVGVRWDGTNATFIRNGILGTPASFAYLPSTSAYRRLRFGWNASGNAAGSNIAGAAIWNRALSDAELQEVGLFPYGTPSQPRLI